MKQNFLLVCESVILDKLTGNMSLIGLFDKFMSPGTPIFANFAVVTRFEGGSGEHNHKILVKNSSGSEIARLEGKIKFGENNNTQYIGRFAGLPLKEFGKYMIEAYVDDELQPVNSTFNVSKI